ncbi:MAG TPA: ATP-binding cassette domain-containing protein [Thermoplasmatales archaeon]|nr:ATP-binding cassette domain-containing protein [Thermoplasmatales archaeon]
MNAISIENLRKEYDGIVAVDGISFSVEEGEIFALLGPNGAGKTTTVRILTCQIKANGGAAKIFGYDVNKDCSKIRRIIGIMPQETSLNELLTAEQNILFYGMLYDLPVKEAKKRGEELLEAMGLFHRKDELVKNFSGGMKQRLSLIIALLHKPKILFLDEPTTGLDPQARRHIWDFIKEINNEGTTIFLTTHYMEEADYLCDRVAIMDNGKIIALDTPAKLKSMMEREKILRIEMDYDEGVIEAIKNVDGVKQISDEDGIIKIIVEDRKGLLLDIIRNISDRNIKSIATVEPTLEDVFITLTGKRLRD